MKNTAEITSKIDNYLADKLSFEERKQVAQYLGEMIVAVVENSCEVIITKQRVDCAEPTAKVNI